MKRCQMVRSALFVWFQCLFTFAPLHYLMTLQQQLPNGKNGATGPNAQHLVARAPKSGLVHAVNQLLEALRSVLAFLRRLNVARHQSAKVIALFMFPSLFDPNYTAAVAAEWQDWGQWSICSVSCGERSKLRVRACSGALFGGNDQCSGDSTEAGDCKMSECEGIVMPFIIPCLPPILTICSYIDYTYSWSLINSHRRDHLSQYSFALSFSNILAAVDSKWQEWGPWSKCSVSCGPGSWLRARACSEPLFGGNQQCLGESTEAGVCTLLECPGIHLGSLRKLVHNLWGKKICGSHILCIVVSYLRAKLKYFRDNNYNHNNTNNHYYNNYYSNYNNYYDNNNNNNNNNCGDDDDDNYNYNNCNCDSHIYCSNSKFVNTFIIFAQNLIRSYCSHSCF